MSDPDAEGLIAHLSGGLAPADRAAFREAAETALAELAPACRGPGAVHRVLLPVWRRFFRPPFNDHGSWHHGPRERPLEHGQDRRRPRSLRAAR